MKTSQSSTRLEDLPNIGTQMANHLRALGIDSPAQLRKKHPLAVFNALRKPMGPKHDPCVYYTLLSVEHFFKTGQSLPWWKFTERGGAISIWRRRQPNADRSVSKVI